MPAVLQTAIMAVADLYQGYGDALLPHTDVGGQAKPLTSLLAQVRCRAGQAAGLVACSSFLVATQACVACTACMLLPDTRCPPHSALVTDAAQVQQQRQEVCD